MTDRMFPIQARRGTSEPREIPWTDAAIAYSAYHAMYPGQSLERLAERGGFGWIEYLALKDAGEWLAERPLTGTFDERSAALHNFFNAALTRRTREHPNPHHRTS